MAKTKKAKGGTYALLLRLEGPEEIVVGRLGKFAFPLGYYLYLGSALGGLRNRLARHSRPEKKLRWHIDYLLQRARLIEVWSMASGERLVTSARSRPGPNSSYSDWAASACQECLWAEVARNLPGAQVPIPRFGSSDCHCPSHLVYFAIKPDFALFEERLQARMPGAVLSREIK